MIAGLIILWIVCGWLSVKLDAVQNEIPTKDYLILALFVWPMIVPFQLLTTHKGDDSDE